MPTRDWRWVRWSGCSSQGKSIIFRRWELCNIMAYTQLSNNRSAWCSMRTVNARPVIAIARLNMICLISVSYSDIHLFFFFYQQPHQETSEVETDRSVGDLSIQAVPAQHTILADLKILAQTRTFLRSKLLPRRGQVRKKNIIKFLAKGSEFFHRRRWALKKIWLGDINVMQRRVDREGIVTSEKNGEKIVMICLLLLDI